MIKTITETLTANPSYLKWGSKRLANRFGCSERTMNTILRNLKPVKTNYISSLKTK